MQPAILAAIIAGAVAVTSLVVNAVRDNRRDKRQAGEAKAQRDDAASVRREAFDHQRSERGYADRRDAIVAFLAEVDELVDRAGNQEYQDQVGERRGAPSGWLDGPDLYPLTAAVEKARSKIDLLASPDCRNTARALEELCSRVAQDWDFSGLTEAREAFISAARRDLALPQYGTPGDGQVASPG